MSILHEGRQRYILQVNELIVETSGERCYTNFNKPGHNQEHDENNRESF
jgi:hypothetical protein